MKNHKRGRYLKFIVSSVIVIALVVVVGLFFKSSSQDALNSKNWWTIQSIDAMKYSRDLAGARVNDPTYDTDIDTEVKNIADTGANYIAIATPYDPEFMPYLKQWVSTARKYHLHVWFRGNWSAWEGWYNHKEGMTYDEHIQKTVGFINANPDLFEDGDSFTGCPECENGAEGDPRLNGKKDEHRNFLIKEYEQTSLAFAKQNKKVATNWFSMNMDVAKLIMNSETSAKLGGLVVIDHYVKDPEQLSEDVTDLAKKSNAKILLGEFGAPIPDINGDMDEDAQAKWVDKALASLSKNPNLIGVNYWVNKGGSTEAWNDDNSKRKVVSVITKYFTPRVITGAIKDDLGQLLQTIQISNDQGAITNQSGSYLIKVVDDQKFTFSKEGYESTDVLFPLKGENESNRVITLKKLNPSLGDFIWSFIRRLTGRN